MIQRPRAPVFLPYQCMGFIKKNKTPLCRGPPEKIQQNPKAIPVKIFCKFYAKHYFI